MQQTNGYWVWDDSLAIGIEAVDTQHRRIVDYINELEEARITGDRMGVSQVLIGIIDYTMTHFAFEEELMVLADYPLTQAHKHAHNLFTVRINDYLEQHENGADVTRNLLAELKLWLSQHVQGEDRRYAPFIKKTLTKEWIVSILAKFSLLNFLGQGQRWQHL